jgi:hypothetical protein
VEVFGKRRNQVAVLMLRGREAVQKDKLGRGRFSGFTVENF